MIICLSGFVIAGTSPTAIPISSRTDITVPERQSSCSVTAATTAARYSPHHHQLLQHFAPPPAPHASHAAAHSALPSLSAHALLHHAGSSSSSAESVSSHSASPPLAPLVPGARPGAGAAAALGRCTRVRTLYACLGESEGELSFEPNQIITNVTSSPEPGWLRGTLNGRTGLVPENYVEPLP